MSDYFVLHIRPTSSCNADCSYCSSWRMKSQPYLSVDAYRSSIEYLRDKVLPVVSGGSMFKALSVQFVGGEVLTLPRDYFYEIVSITRQLLEPVSQLYIHGVQSNLVGSPDRILQLDTLFSGNIGTSVETFGNRRTLAGNPLKYRQRVDSSRELLKKRRSRNVGATFVLDAQGVKYAHKELQRAMEEEYNLVLRPVFQGRSSIDAPPMDELEDIYMTCFDEWALKTTVHVEPFSYLLARRAKVTLCGTMCPYKADCAETSLNMDPNGDLYLCFEMADSGHFKMGNAAEKTFDIETWEKLRGRKKYAMEACGTCPYFEDCQAGCMYESLETTGTIEHATGYCPIWKKLFSRMDDLIAEHGQRRVTDWLASLDAQ
ncbi:radical SAM protein [Pseudovibrio ascidiaceicola]|uniref:radical SAM protein n=1 Tax=Pseudovibrio ascidiaceicola TaxID=285279 RepID=UPI003D366887